MAMIKELLQHKICFAILAMSKNDYYAIAMKGKLPGGYRWRRARGYKNVLETKLNDEDAAELKRNMYRFREYCENIFGTVYELHRCSLREKYQESLNEATEEMYSGDVKNLKSQMI